MDRILKGIMKYRKCHREGMVKQFQQVKDHPEVRLYDKKKSRVMILSIDKCIGIFALPRQVWSTCVLLILSRNKWAVKNTFATPFIKYGFINKITYFKYNGSKHDLKP